MKTGRSHAPTRFAIRVRTHSCNNMGISRMIATSSYGPSGASACTDWLVCHFHYRTPDWPCSSPRRRARVLRPGFAYAIRAHARDRASGSVRRPRSPLLVFQRVPFGSSQQRAARHASDRYPTSAGRVAHPRAARGGSRCDTARRCSVAAVCRWPCGYPYGSVILNHPETIRSSLPPISCSRRPCSCAGTSVRGSKA